MSEEVLIAIDNILRSVGASSLTTVDINYITNKQMYDNIQLSVEFICDKVKMPKIYFEYFSQQFRNQK